MSEKLGTCDKWGEPHERVVIFAPQLDLDIENHYCNWQPLPTPSETPSEPVLAHGPLCGDIYPATRSGCTCGHESGHAGKHKCGGCSFEWESPNPITAMAEPSEPPTDQLVRVIESLFYRIERERLWHDNLSDEQTHSKSFSDGIICGLAIATEELTPLAESLARVLATPPTDETKEGE